ncbi:1-phosphofructokinase [Alkalicoccobacillus murimartini]|uniref:Tagatose-6-phosphate kinase n=1 Tax=Alkalicoccobacillus murimartini TaxID=171685 RepID=A0ABT9YKE8_9BACI|nr:1-phosphofructokinase [Alkalicoccobacillus murimartini]MDQ0208328.1 1-phosphofructokinase [Alkalicoccobacillus murimartini]
MIYTVTLNPAVDYFVELDDLKPGQVNRSRKEHKAPGGKGINVSRVLKRLGHSSQTLGFIGGFTGDYIIHTLQEEDIKTSFVEVDGDTRINIKMKGTEETELNGTSPEITQSHLSQLNEQLDRLTESDILVLAGSVPGSLEKNIYTEWIHRVKKNGVKVFLDTSGHPLIDAVEAAPTFIKPNHHELSELVGAEINTPEESLPYVKELTAKGIDYVFVTFAGDGAVLGTKEQVLFATTPKGTVQNSVGAGDSTLAGFLAASHKDVSLEEAFRFAVASGSSTAFSKGFCELSHVEELMEQVKITVLK